MAIRRSTHSKRSAVHWLVVHLDDESASLLANAAQLRRTSVSEYVRTVSVAQAHREIEAAENQTILLTPDEQFTFWKALQAVSNPTRAQCELGAIMRGEA